MVDLGCNFRNQCCLSSRGNGSVQGEESGFAAHDLDEEEALVAAGRVADAVHTPHDGIQCRVIADGVVGATQVIIDGARNSHNGEVKLAGKLPGAAQRAVTSDDYQRVDAVFLDVVIGNPDAQKDVIIQYSMHAREYVNSLLGMKQIEELLKGMNNGTQYNGVAYSDILQNVRLHLIPMMNPDGVMIALYGFDAIGNETLRNGLYECWQNDILLGKGDPDILAYYRRWKANARCVDLNRNFDCGWETTIGTTQPSCSRYKGESAASEAETKALVALKDAINCVGQIAYHSEGELVYWDYGSLGDLHVVDEQLADLVSGITGYTKESTVSSNQETAGCSDYFILECSIPSITIETGVGECPIYVDQWDTIWNQNAQVLPAIAQFFAQQGE